MAVSDSAIGTTTAQRRFFIGTNVTVMILLALFMLVAVNWLGQRWNSRRDMAGGFSGTRLSSRTQKILDKVDGELRISTVYTSDEPDLDKKKYLPKLKDLTQEITRYRKNIRVDHLYTGAERAELRSRVTGKFGSEAEKYKEVIELARASWADLGKKLEEFRNTVEAVSSPPHWLSTSSVLANLGAELNQHLESLKQTERDVEDLIDESKGLPKFQEAHNKVKEFDDKIKGYMEKMQNWARQTESLVKILQDKNSDFPVKTRSAVQEIKEQFAGLQQIIGSPTDPNVPADPKPLIQDFAKAAGQLATRLSEEKGRLDAFVKANPGIARHPRWTIKIQQAIFVMQMGLTDVLAENGNQLTRVHEQLRQYLKQDNIPLDQWQNLVRELRQMAVEMARALGGNYIDNILALLDDGDRVDPASKDFLAKCGGGEMFKEPLAKLAEIATKGTDLPKLALDDLADKLQQENIVVIEGPKDARVIPFDDVWGAADPTAERFGRNESQERKRVFVGDTAIGNAILSMQNEKPIATVILTGFEPSMGPQMPGQMPPRPNEGPLPLRQFTELQQRLEKANFKVKTWNLGGEGEAANKPEPEAGTQAIYLILPPAGQPPQMNPFSPPPQTRKFGDSELQQIKQALADGGKAIFLNVWIPPEGGMMGDDAPVDDPLAPLLRDDWGIEVKHAYRVIRGEQDRRDPERYSINVKEFNHMQLSSFNEKHPIGAPLAARRMLLNQVCPVVKLDKTPADVTVTSVLSVPREKINTWASNLREIRQIIAAIRSGDRDGLFTRDVTNELLPPFDVILAAENTKTNSRIVVAGIGYSPMDFHLQNRVPRLEGKESSRLVMDPPPTEVVDLCQNMLLWLAGRDDLIAAGPARTPVVPVLTESGRRNVWILTMGWACLAMVAGITVMTIRRK